MPTKEADHQGSPMEQLIRGDLHMILIEQGEARRTVSNFQRGILNPRSFQFGRGAMHRFDSLARRVVRRCSGFECRLEFVQTILKV